MKPLADATPAAGQAVLLGAAAVVLVVLVGLGGLIAAAAAVQGRVDEELAGRGWGSR